MFLDELSSYDYIGIVGVGILFYGYFRFTQEENKMLFFLVFNAIGSSLVAISFLDKWNLSGFLIEAGWFFISIFGIVKLKKDKHCKEI